MSLNELSRVLMHLNKRRGFKSNRKELTNPEGDKLEGKILELEKKLKENNYRTIGEFYYKTLKKGEGVRLKENRDLDFYPVRELYENEFEKVIKKQKEFHQELTKDVVDNIKKIIFDQRPLKAQEKGKCVINNEYNRSYKTLPTYEDFILKQNIENLQYHKNGKMNTLTNKEKTALYSTLISKKTMTFKAIRKFFKLDEENLFNLESEKRKSLSGVNSNIILQKSIGAEIWEKFSPMQKDFIVTTFLEEHFDGEIEKKLKNPKENNSNQINKIKGISDEKIKILIEKFPHHKISKNMGNLSVETIYDILGKHDWESKTILDLMKELQGSTNKIKIEPSLREYQYCLKESLVPRPNASNEIEKNKGVFTNPVVHVCLNPIKACS